MDFLGTASLRLGVACGRSDTCGERVYPPDPLWQQLHPVQQAQWWYVEYRGKTPNQQRAGVQLSAERAEAQQAARAERATRPHAAPLPSAPTDVTMQISAVSVDPTPEVPVDAGELQPSGARAAVIVVAVIVIVALGGLVAFLR